VPFGGYVLSNPARPFRSRRVFVWVGVPFPRSPPSTWRVDANRRPRTPPNRRLYADRLPRTGVAPPDFGAPVPQKWRPGSRTRVSSTFETASNSDLDSLNHVQAGGVFAPGGWEPPKFWHRGLELAAAWTSAPVSRSEISGVSFPGNRTSTPRSRQLPPTRRHGYAMLEAVPSGETRCTRDARARYS
jgi:hypothetical protein